MKKEELELLLSLATDDVSKQLLSESIKKIEDSQKKRVKRDLKKESSLAKIVRARREKFYNWLKDKQQNLIKNQTPQEIRIKALLKSLNITYEFQKICMEGVNGYIPDFYLPFYKLVIEIDGSQHYTNEGKLKDKKRTKELIKYNKIKGVLRLSNYRANAITESELKELIVNYKEPEENLPLPKVVLGKQKKKKGFTLPQKQIDKMTPKGRRNYLRNNPN
jgi:very-short-patch-repair endonuclease